MLLQSDRQSLAPELGVGGDCYTSPVEERPRLATANLGFSGCPPSSARIPQLLLLTDGGCIVEPHLGGRKYSDSQIGRNRHRRSKDFASSQTLSASHRKYVHSMLNVPLDVARHSAVPQPPSAGAVHNPAAAPSAQNPLVELSSEYMRVVGGTRALKRFLSKYPSSSKSNSKDGDEHLPNNVGNAGTGGHVVNNNMKRVSTQLTVEDLKFGPDGVPGSGLESRSRVSSKSSKKSDVRAAAAVAAALRDKPEMIALNLSDESLGQRLRRRKRLSVQRSNFCDYSLLSALCGIVIMLIESELCASGKIKKGDTTSDLLKAAIVLSTAVLVALIFLYHWTEVKLSVIDSGTDDWTVSITWSRIVQFLLEELICVLCPCPGTGFFYWPNIISDSCLYCFYSNKDYLKRNIVYGLVPVDVLLTIPMFIRCYLLGRYMVLHSHLFRDAATRSIASLNRVTVDFKFVVKTKMYERPLLVMVLFAVCYCITISWVYAQCERHTVSELQTSHEYLSAVWYIVVTFLTIGYGDVVPNTYCGRTLGIATGIMGAGVSSALIAVISRKLELTKAEKHVNAFMADSQLTKRRKNAAARVLQQTWFIYKHRYLLMNNSEMKIRLHQRKFLAAITDFRRVKLEQRKLTEQNNMLIDIAKVQTELQGSIYELQQSHKLLLGQVHTMMENLAEFTGRFQLGEITPDGNYSMSRVSPQSSVSRQRTERDRRQRLANQRQYSIRSGSTYRSRPVSFDMDYVP